MSDRLLRVARIAPWGIVFGLVVILVATPWELERAMVEMTLQGMPARSVFSDTTSRYSWAEQWFADREYERASQEWPHMRFAKTAELAAHLMPDEIDRECRQGLAREGMLASDSSVYSALAGFVDENPGTEVAMYLVPQPPMPSLELTMSAHPDDRLPGEYEALWHAIVGPVDESSFDPGAWAPPGGFAETGSSQVWSFMVADGGAGRFRRQIVLGDPGSDRERLLKETNLWFERREHSERLHAPVRDASWVGYELDVCSGCHMEHDTGRKREEPALNLVRWGHTMFLTEPMELQALEQVRLGNDSAGVVGGLELLLHALGDEDHEYFELADALLEERGPDGAVSSANATLVWVVPESDTYGQTYLFFCSFPGDPVGDFEEALASPGATRVRSIRSWIAAYTPPVLGAGLLVLMGTVIVAPVAAGVKARADAQRQLQVDLERVRRDAHDRVYNRLTALSRRVDEAAEGGGAELVGVGDDIRSTVEELQQILGAAQGDSDQPISLVRQLEAVAKMQIALHGVEVDFVVEGDVPEVAPRLAWDLQCVLEEAITNAVKHGDAGRIVTRLGVEAGMLLMSVQDDGIGFSAEAAGSRDSTGIAGMRGRIDSWGGTLEVDPVESGGTRVTIIVAAQ